jgi:hypothetical protein
MALVKMGIIRHLSVYIKIYRETFTGGNVHVNVYRAKDYAEKSKNLAPVLTFTYGIDVNLI